MIYRALEVTLFVFACIATHKWRKERKASRRASGNPRALDHSEFANEHHVYDGTRISAPPKYEEDARDIEMSPTSATNRDFV